MPLAGYIIRQIKDDCATANDDGKYEIVHIYVSVWKVRMVSQWIKLFRCLLLPFLEIAYSTCELHLVSSTVHSPYTSRSKASWRLCARHVDCVMTNACASLKEHWAQWHHYGEIKPLVAVWLTQPGKICSVFLLQNKMTHHWGWGHAGHLTLLSVSNEN